MPRLRTRDGVIVNVSEEKAARLGSAYAPAEAEPAAKAPAKRSASRKTTGK